MDEISMMDWQATPPAAEINAQYNPALLERRHPRDGFEIPNMPGGWIDYYTERQFDLQDVVQFQHLAKPSIITCVKKAVSQAKRRCISVAASVCQAPIHLFTMAQNTHTNVGRAIQTVHDTAGPTVNQIVRRVRQVQAARRRRHVTPQRSPQRSPHLAGKIQKSPAPLSTPNHSSPPGAPPDPTNSPRTPLHEMESADIPFGASLSFGGNSTPIFSRRTPAQCAGFHLFWDAPTPSHWLNSSHELSFIQRNKTPETLQPPSPPRAAAEYQLLAELEEALPPSSEGPETVLPTNYKLPTTPQRNLKPYPSYMEGNDSDFSSHLPENPQDITEFSSYCPFSPEISEIASDVPAYSPDDITEFSSHVPFSPDLTDCRSHGSVQAHVDGKDLSSHIPTDAHDSKDLSQIRTDAHEGGNDASSCISIDAYGDGEEISSYVVDSTKHDVTPEWYEEPAVSPFTKSPDTPVRRVTRLSIRKEAEEQKRKKEQRQRNLEKSKICALSEEWENKVYEAVRAGFAPDYTAADFARVVPSQQGGFTDSWLNDESVNGYLKIVTKFHNAHHPSAIPKSHAFPSFMLKQIAEKGYKGVERWAKRAKIGGTNLLQTHTIFIPVNSGSHWTLMVVYPSARTAHYYDSMGRNRYDNGKRWFDLVKIWLRGELGEHYNEREWAFFDKESPQQNNSSDCGVFAATTAKMLILGVDVLSYGPNDIPTQRKRMVAELVNGDFL